TRVTSQGTSCTRPVPVMSPGSRTIGHPFYSPSTTLAICATGIRSRPAPMGRAWIAPSNSVPRSTSSVLNQKFAAQNSEKATMNARGLTVAVGLAAVVFCAHSQTLDQPQPALPQKDAGYLLADGTIRIVGWDDLSGMFDGLNALYVKSHPGAKFIYVPGNLIAPQHSLIFGETAFAPIGMEFSS